MNDHTHVYSDQSELVSGDDNNILLKTLVQNNKTVY